MFTIENQLLAVMPATEHGREIRSHGGLTYGGLIFDHRMSLKLMLQCFYGLCKYFKKCGFENLIYKPVPHIYHIRPSEEDLYALFRCNGKIIARGPSATIDLLKTEIPGKKKNGAKKGVRLGLLVCRVDNPSRLVDKIDSNLRKRHGVSAVHSSQELVRLSSTFPKNIEVLELVDSTGQLFGGAIVYLSSLVAHTQYMIVNDMGRPMRGMDVLVAEMMARYKDRYRYLDFGISSENHGWFLNNSLMMQKESFSASTVCYDAYHINFTDALTGLSASRDAYIFEDNQNAAN
jgi:hypothetical protein